MIHFWIDGVPAPGGSKKQVGTYKKRTRSGAIVTIPRLVDDCKRNAEWREQVAWAARIAYKGVPLDCPLKLSITFYMPRPKSHYNRLGLREDAPQYPTTKPDASKLTRSTEDALTDILWADDARIVNQDIKKRYVDGDGKPGAQIKLEVL